MTATYDALVRQFRRDLPLIIAGRDPMPVRPSPTARSAHKRRRQPGTAPDGLTDRQRETLRFIQDYLDQHGVPPLVVEICLHFDIAEPGSILTALQRKGWIARAGTTKARNMRLLRRLPEERDSNG
jgi:hypothetical protein